MFIYLCIHITYMNYLFPIVNQSNIFAGGINRFKTRQLDWAKVEDTATQAQVAERGFDNEGIYYFCYNTTVFSLLYCYIQY